MKRKGNIAIATLLIGTGAFYLAIAVSPVVQNFAFTERTWPFQIIVIGLLFFLAGIFSLSPGFFIPASIITGLGGLLYYQNFYNDWNSWSYTWTVILAFIGIGLLLYGIFSRKTKNIQVGLWMIFISLVLFSIFGFILGNIPYIKYVWPVAVIMLGFFFLYHAIKRPGAEKLGGE